MADLAERLTQQHATECKQLGVNGVHCLDDAIRDAVRACAREAEGALTGAGASRRILALIGE